MRPQCRGSIYATRKPFPQHLCKTGATAGNLGACVDPGQSLLLPRPRAWPAAPVLPITLLHRAAVCCLQVHGQAQEHKVYKSPSPRCTSCFRRALLPHETRSPAACCSSAVSADPQASIILTTTRPCNTPVRPALLQHRPKIWAARTLGR